MRISLAFIFFALSIQLLSCGGSRVPEQSPGHISQSKNSKAETAKRNIPKPIAMEPVLPKPQIEDDEQVYTIVVHQVPIRELLFALARDAKINIDIEDGIEGTATLNAIDQSLEQILERLTSDNHLVYEVKSHTIKIRRDLPFIKIYPVDYLNISRNSSSQVNVATEISSTGRGALSESGSGTGGSGNSNSNTVLNNVSNNQFWDTLEQNIRFILGETQNNQINQEFSGVLARAQTDANSGSSPNRASQRDDDSNRNSALVSSNDDSPQSNNTGSSAQSNVIVNRESGVIAVNATQRQHKEVQAFIDKVVTNSKRQVLIEATIAEVNLGDNYLAGIDWSSVQTSVSGATFNQSVLGENLSAAPIFTLSITDNTAKNPLRLTLRALEEFGEVKVLSSPKIMVLNNQTALLKVVDNVVYFTIDVDISDATENSSRLITYETEVHTVPIGFVMAVTAFVNEQDNITLNIRPTISRQIGTAIDPNPVLAENNVQNAIPLIQVREMESILKVNDGDTAVLGGLMQNETNKKSSGVPLVSGIPMVGNLFSTKDNKYGKTELVIFIKPTIIKTASLEKDLKPLKQFLPYPYNPRHELPPVQDPFAEPLRQLERSKSLFNTNPQSNANQAMGSQQ